jgi:p-aminobenzoyl-glutamate transporter AbgT
LDPTPGDPGNSGEAPSGDEPLLVKTSATGSGLSRGLLYAALSLLVVELLMAWHFLAGAGSLAAIVLVAMTFWLWAVSPFAGIAGGIATVAAAVWGWNSIRSRSLG